MACKYISIQLTGCKRAVQAAAASEEAVALKSVRSNTGSTQSSRAASLSSVSSLGSPVASAANPYALFALRPEPATLARFSTGTLVYVILSN